MLNNRPSTQTIPDPGSSKPNFREAKRIQQSFLANAEKRTLIWLAARTPAWINSDHLTLLGLLSMAAAGAAYWWSATNRLGLILVILCLALNWLGDSLDGTLARFRDHSRPRYGFYVDHIVDAFSAFFLLGGLALSGYMSPAVALGLLDRLSDVVGRNLSRHVCPGRLQNFLLQNGTDGVAHPAFHRQPCRVVEVNCASLGPRSPAFRCRGHARHFRHVVDHGDFRRAKHHAAVP